MAFHNAFAEQDHTLNMTDQMDDYLILLKDAAPYTRNKSCQIKRTYTEMSFNIHPEVGNTSSTSLRESADMVLISAGM
jgi:hypothetical protein